MLRGNDLPLEAALVRQGRAWRVCDIAVYGISFPENLRVLIVGVHALSGVCILAQVRPEAAHVHRSAPGSAPSRPHGS